MVKNAVKKLKNALFGKSNKNKSPENITSDTSERVAVDTDVQHIQTNFEGKHIN